MSTVTAFLQRLAGPVKRPPAATPALTLRYARPADAAGLDRLAALDSSRAPRGAVLVAEVEGELWAAVSLDDRHAVADPFRPTGELVALLLERARQLGRGRSGHEAAALPRVWPQHGYDRPALG